METTNQVAMLLGQWDEPEGCASARGWYGIPFGCQETTAGNYVDYGTIDPYYHRTHPEGTFHAVAYFEPEPDPISGLRQGCVRLGSAWLPDAETARQWIQDRVAEHLRSVGII